MTQAAVGKDCKLDGTSRRFIVSNKQSPMMRAKSCRVDFVHVSKHPSPVIPQMRQLS
jgi:hypothetical protein